MCANHVVRALDVPFIGADDATEAYEMMKAAGKINTTAPVPVGAMLFWTGGSGGHGHVAIRHPNGPTGTSLIASTDVNGPRTTGVVPFSWFAKNWPDIKYVGWSWYWGKTNTQMEEVPVADWVEGQDKVIERENVTVIAGKYNKMGTITLGESGSYLLTFQTRLPAGKKGRWQFTRVGWGKDPDGRDETGPNPLTPPDGDATSFTHTHRINGGKKAVVDFELKVSGTGKVTLPYVICKAERIT
jgi:hypothetical protein